MVMNVLIVIQLFSFMVMCAGAVGGMFAAACGCNNDLCMSYMMMFILGGIIALVMLFILGFCSENWPSWYLSFLIS